MMDSKEIFEHFSSGKYQEPENCFEIPLEAWDKQHLRTAKRFLELFGLALERCVEHDDVVNIIYSYIKREQTEAFARGLSLGYMAFGHRKEAVRTAEISDKLSAVDSIALYSDILSKMDHEALSRFIQAGLDND